MNDFGRGRRQRRGNDTKPISGDWRFGQGNVQTGWRVENYLILWKVVLDMSASFEPVVCSVTRYSSLAILHHAWPLWPCLLLMCFNNHRRVDVSLSTDSQCFLTHCNASSASLEIDEHTDLGAATAQSLLGTRLFVSSTITIYTCPSWAVRLRESLPTTTQLAHLVATYGNSPSRRIGNTFHR